MKLFHSSTLAYFSSKKLGIVIAFIFLIIELAIKIKKTEITRSWGRILSAISAIFIAIYLLSNIIAI